MKIKVSVWQLICLVFSFQVGLSLLLSPQPAIEIAKQDTWISVLVAGAGVFVIAFICVRLSSMYPTQTIVQFSQTILGKWFGKLIMVPYFIMWTIVSGMILRQFSDFVHVTMFTRTPLWALVIPFVLLGTYSLHKGGYEILARCSELIGPLVVVVFFTAISLNWPNMRWGNILPIYADTGIRTIFRGSLPILSFFGELVLIMMTLPLMEKPQKAFFAVSVAGGMTTLLVLISVIVEILTFGPQLASKMLYPAFEVTRYISTMEFIQNLDVLVVLVWFLTYFVKLGSYFFFLCFGISQWLNSNKWKRPIWVIAPLTTIIALWPRNFTMATVDFFDEFWIRYVLPINMVGIPLFLWIVGTIQKRMKAKPKSESL